MFSKLNDALHNCTTADPNWLGSPELRSLRRGHLDLSAVIARESYHLGIVRELGSWLREPSGKVSCRKCRSRGPYKR